MAEVPVEIRGTLYDLQNKSSRQVVLLGKASIYGLGVGGGPIIPPDGGGGGDGDHIWGGGNVPMPSPPISNVPGAPGYRPPGDHIWGGGNEPFPTPPIAFPPGWVGGVPPNLPPGVSVPEPPAPGSPTTAVPGNWPVQPIQPPAYMIVQYPGIGPVVVAPPAGAAPT